MTSSNPASWPVIVPSLRTVPFPRFQWMISNDVRALIGDDNALEAGILPALQQYNIEQFVVASLPDNQQVGTARHASASLQPHL